MKRLIVAAVVLAMLPMGGSAAPEERHPLANCASSFDENGHDSGVECWQFVVIANLASD